jgi:hypothetical protein
MKTNGHDQPTDREWADAPLHVERTDWAKEPTRSILKLEKRIERNGKTYTQHIWINIHQLRGVAEDQLNRRPPAK